MTTLGELISLQRGYDLTETQRRYGAVPIVGSAGVHGYHDTARSRGPGVILGRSGASFGKVTFIQDDFWPHNTTIFVTDFKGNEPKFIRYLLENIDFSSLNSGSAQQSLNRNYIYPIKVSKFPLPIQRRIAGILSAYDELIENNQRRIKILETMARALYREWFVHFRFPGHENVRRVPSPLGEIPEGWKVTTLRSVTSKIGSGATPRGGKESYQAEGISLIRSLNIYDYHFEFSSLAFIDEQQAATLDNVTVEKNDILLNITGASVARCSLVPTHVLPARVNQHVAIIRSDFTKVSPFYLLDTINSDNRKAQLLTLAQGGATREALTKETISNFEIVLPPSLLIYRYGNIASGIHTHREFLQRQTQTLRRTRDLLLPRLLSGQIDMEALPHA